MSAANTPGVSIYPNNATDYFTKLLEDDLKAVVKPQYVDQIPRAVRAADKSVKTLIEMSDGGFDDVFVMVPVIGRLRLPG